MEALHALDLEIYDKALARVGEVTPNVCQIEDLVTSELSQSPAKPPRGRQVPQAQWTRLLRQRPLSWHQPPQAPSAESRRQGTAQLLWTRDAERTGRPTSPRRLRHPRRRTLRTSAGYASETEIKEVHGAAAHSARPHLSTP